MTLTNRLTLFFLAALAVVLAGFSAALYLLARQHLHRQMDERLDTSLHVLSAAIENTPIGLEWEPSERQLKFGRGEDGLAWLVTDPGGEVVDRAGPAAISSFANSVARSLQAAGSTGDRFEHESDDWLFWQVWIETPIANYRQSAARGPDRRYRALGITVGMSLAPVRTTLRELGAALAGLSVVVLVLALAGGRVVCRRALRPVIAMAQAAHRMDAAALDQRLPVLANGDELEGLARAFNDLLTRVQLAFERQQRFAGEASHQLRTPLTAVIGAVEVALRRERPVEEYQRVLTTVRQQADRLNRIVEALLFLARADAEAQSLQAESVELSTWLPDHLRCWHDHLRWPDVTKEVVPAQVKVHPVLLGELLNVLLDNAFKYSQAGTRITVRVTRTTEAVMVSVEDGGSGIAEEDLPHLFEPFFRSSSARLRGIEGFGLGLSVAKRIATALGGDLTVESVVGEGSRFTLQLRSGRESSVRSG